jgi:hypothetical protein
MHKVLEWLINNDSDLTLTNHVTFFYFYRIIKNIEKINAFRYSITGNKRMALSENKIILKG